MATVFPFSALLTAALVIDAVYEGGTRAIRRTMFWARPSRRRLSSRLPLGRQLVCAWSSDLLFQDGRRGPGRRVKAREQRLTEHGVNRECRAGQPGKTKGLPNILSPSSASSGRNCSFSQPDVRDGDKPST